jgi:hypothetical protein
MRWIDAGQRGCVEGAWTLVPPPRLPQVLHQVQRSAFWCMSPVSCDGVSQTVDTCAHAAFPDRVADRKRDGAGDKGHYACYTLGRPLPYVLSELLLDSHDVVMRATCIPGECPSRRVVLRCTFRHMSHLSSLRNAMEALQRHRCSSGDQLRFLAGRGSRVPEAPGARH